MIGLFELYQLADALMEFNLSKEDDTHAWRLEALVSTLLSQLIELSSMGLSFFNLGGVFGKPGFQQNVRFSYG